MDNPELILQSLEHFSSLKDDIDLAIPIELEEYIHYVAKTGDPVFQWTLVKPLMKEKMMKVISEFFESNPGDIPEYPNVDKFNYETMKTTLMERMDWFKGAPFTIQRISELLINPTKEYNRVDKYMRALEKNIFVVSTREPGMPQPVEENNSFEESFILNGNDFELKSDNEVLGNKQEEDSEDNMLLLKKCSNGDSEEGNFNIEVDVTNTTTPEDVTGDDNLESAEINVHDESPELSETSISEDEKSGQSRKLEDGEQSENDPKRFKIDDFGESGESDDLKQDSGDQSKDSEDNMNIEESTVSETTKQNEIFELNTPPAQESENKEEIEMELEENIETKIQSFTTEAEMELEDNMDTKIQSWLLADKDNANISESIVNSQEPSVSSTEEKEESIEEDLEAGSSDMDLSDPVNDNPAVKDNLLFIRDVLTSVTEEESSDPKPSIQPEKDNLVFIGDAAEAVTEPEEPPTVASVVASEDIASSSVPTDEISETSEETTLSSEETSGNNECKNDTDTITEPATSEEQDAKVESTNAGQDDTSTSVPVTSETSIENEAQPSSVASSDECPREKPNDVSVAVNEEKVENAVVESTSDRDEIEEAILQDEEFEGAECSGSNVDPLSVNELEEKPSAESKEVDGNEAESAPSEEKETSKQKEE